MNVFNTSSTVDPVYMYNYVNTYMLNPFVIAFIAVLLIFLLFSSSLGSGMGTMGSLDFGGTSNFNSFSLSSSSSNASSGGLSKGIIIFIGVVFLLLLSVNALAYFFSVDVTAYINDLFTTTPKLDIVVDESNASPSPLSAPVPEIRFKKQVFNIPGNYYTYDNARALCKAYGADLATYEQIEKAYQNGAEWCNYGWSANQNAFFPTQKKTYDNLQKIKGHENDCGRPGINGGYIANPNVRFGVNCYGYKPKMTEAEEELMKDTTPYPETTEDIAFQKKVDMFKNNLTSILVSPFNYKMWGEI